MFRRLLLSGLSVIFLLSACKKKPVENDAEYYRPIWEAVQAFESLETTMNDYSRQGYSAKAALVAASIDLQVEEQVTSTTHFDSTYVYITMASGMESVYALIPVDANGEPLYRGGGADGMGSMSVMSGDCTNEITNKKILLFNAEFQTKSTALQVLNDQKDNFELEIKKLGNSNCTYDVVTTFGDYGLVVINTHGLPNGFLLGQSLPVTVQDNIPSLEAFAEAINSNPQRSIDDQKLIDNQLGLAATKHYDPTVPIHEQYFQDADTIALFISAKQIGQLDLSGTIVFGNMCYSGYDNSSQLPAKNIPILEGFRQAKTKAYYGYQQTAKLSTTVNSTPAEEIEEYLYKGFFEEEDSTGSAHLDDNGNERHDYEWNNFPSNAIKNFGKLYLRHFFADNWCYDGGCQDTLLDIRDGSVYKTVCIGNQVWMAENLKWDGAGICYDNNPAKCDSFGRLYSLTELTNLQYSTPTTTVQGLCPKGWHVPSKDEIDTLVAFCGGPIAAADKLLSSSGWPSAHSNVTGFNLKPTGYYTTDFNNSVFGGFGVNGAFWTSSENSSGWNLAFRYSDAATSIGQYSDAGTGQAWYFSCRCIKD